MQQIFKGAVPSLFIFLLASCGLLAACDGSDSGGGGAGGGGETTAPSNLSYPQPPALIVGQTMTPLTPTVTGQVTSYSVAPALPAGLTLNAPSGVISGTPTVAAAAATYTITAQNGAGKAAATVSIVVSGGVAPQIAYASPGYSFSANVASQTIEPTVKGGAVVKWSVTPALPAGLALDPTDGNISGTPTAAAAAESYVVSASNPGGQSQATLTLAVGPAPLLDVVQTNTISFLRFTGTAVLSLSNGPGLIALGHWALQNYASGVTLASGNLTTCGISLYGDIPGTYPPIDLGGDTMIDPNPAATCGGSNAPSGLEIRSASTGKVLSTIPGQFWWYQLASDGSYVVVADQSSLKAYSPAGKMLFSVPGIFRTAQAFSTPKQIQLVFITCPGDPAQCPSPGGQNVIETIPVATGTPAATAPFEGKFFAWFPDGARFVAFQGASMLIYSSAGVQQDSKVISSSFGLAQGPWFWTLSEQILNVYQVGASATPAYSATLAQLEPSIVASGSTLGIFNGSGLPGTQLTVIDLSGSVPASATYTPLTGWNEYLNAYAATSATEWLTGYTLGVVFDGASIAAHPRYLAFGAAQSIAGGTGYFSVSTASGQVFNFDSSTQAPAGTISLASTSNSLLSMSANGSVLAAYSLNPPNSIINIYSLPDATPIDSFPFGENAVSEMSLSGSGSVLAQSPSDVDGCYAATVAVSGGGAPIWCGTTHTINTVQLSPDGTLVAASTKPQSDPYPVTSIYKNGTLTTSVTGWVVGWLDNGRFLADNYQQQPGGPVTGTYLGNFIYSSQGTVLSTPSLPALSSIDVVSTDTVYSPGLNTIFSLTTSSPTWLSGDTSTGVGAVSGSQVVFASGTLILAQPF